ncbi:MAG: DUF6516 family protein [bacterium]|nr:DUF6516 family protein [bacterium]
MEKFKAKVILCDGSNLRISETWIDRRLFGYSYYWLDENNNQIIGWDNAPHHLELDNYPHHKLSAASGRNQTNFGLQIADYGTLKLEIGN